MKKSILFLFLMPILFIKSYGQEPAATANPNDRFTLASDMSDEFNNGGINWSGKWERTNNLPNIAAWNLVNNNNVSRGNFFNRGAARITARYNGVNSNGTSVAVNGKFYNSGCLQSKKTLPVNFEGYIEAVIRGADVDNPNPHPFNGGIDKSRGLCPAFWLYSKFFDNNPANGGVVYTEIDIQELQQHDFYNGVQDRVEDTESNLHVAFKNGNGRRWVRPKQNANAQLNKYPLGFDPRKGWHTYGCQITRDEIHFFVDGKKVGKTLKNTHWGKLPMRVILSLGMRVPFVDFGGNAFTSFDPQGNYPGNQRLQTLAERARRQLGELPESMYVDYVRVWNKVGNDNPPPSGSDEFYIINRATGLKLRPASNKNGAQIRQASANNTSNWVKWKKIDSNNGWFFFRNTRTGKYFRPKGASGNNKNSLEQQPTSSNGSWTQWKEIPSNSGYVFLKNRASGKHIIPVNNKVNSLIRLTPSTLINNRTQWQLQPVGKKLNNSIEEINSDIKVHPNPTKDYVTIELGSSKGSKNAKVSVVNILGNIVIAPRSINNSEIVLDVSKLSKGLYFLKIQNGTSSFSKRLVIK